MTKHVWSGILVLLISFLIFEFTKIDLFIQDFLYNAESSQWILDRNAELPRLLLYDGIKKIYIIFVLAVLLSLVFFRRHPVIANNKKGLLIVLLSCLTVPLFIGFLKSVTNIPCPKDIQHYGGNYPYVTVLSKYPDTFHQKSNIQCYPAGHASGGFALMSLFFLFASKRKKKIALISAITTGWIIGGYKMIIGDHFFSHTLMTMIISWLLIITIHYLVNYFAFHRSRQNPVKI